MKLLLKSIGAADDLLEHLDKAKLAFQHPALLWVGLLLLLPVGYYITCRQRHNLTAVPMRIRSILSATRIATLAILVLVLSGPYLRIDHQIIRKPIVAVLFDRSQSMHLPAGPFESEDQLRGAAAAAGYDMSDLEIDAEVRKALNHMDRAELAQAAIRAAEESLLKPLQSDYELRYYAFARETLSLAFDPSRSDAPAAAAGGGNASHIGEAIYHVLEEAAGRHVAGILLLSDGQNTGGRSPSQAARAAADARTAIFAAPLGSNQRMRDVSVIDVYTSGRVAVGDTVAVHVTLEAQGFDGRHVQVELKDGEKVLDNQRCVVHDAEHQRVELTFEAKRPGARYLTVIVPPPEEESVELHANNTDTAFVRISEEKLRVLLVEGLPRWDFRFLKNAIRRDHGLTGRTGEAPDVVLEAEWRRFRDAVRSSLLPQSPEDISVYHTIILGDVSPELFSARLQDLVIEAVRDQGVGLIVAAGTQSMPHRFDERFHGLLPVRLQSGVAGMEAPAYKPFRLAVSPNGIIHEAMRLYDDPGRNQDVWAHIPPYYWCAAAERPAPGATVLAWNPSVEGRYGRMPLIAHHYAGEGKVMFVGTDSTWLWRQNVGDRYFYKFWGQSIRFVARRDPSAGKKSWIEVRPVRAQAGEEAHIELMAFKADGGPEKSPARTVTWLAPDSRQTVELAADQTKKGRYTGGFTPEKPGAHLLVYEPSGGSHAVEAAIQVLLAPEEYRHPNLNRPALELLVNASGGKVVELDELGSIPAELKGETELKQLHREATIWDNWLSLSVLILVYSIDVGIRRMMGLS